MATDVRVTDEEIARQREKLGQRVQLAEPPFLTEVTRDAIRHWAWATGDRNPLYLDEAHAARGPHGVLIAPPCMLYGFDRLSIGYRGGLPGIHAMFGGSWWRWRRPARLGERIHTEVTYKDLVELPSRFSGRMFKQISLVQFFNDQGEAIAESDSWGMRTERVTARKKGKYNKLERTPVTPEQLRDVAQRYAEERPRGAEPLFWEDVEVGADVPEMVRGPYSATTAVAFEQAWGGLFIWAHGYWFDYLAAHPAAGIPNAYNVPEPPEAVHWDSALARSVGVPEAYDYGPERIAWMATMLTNWIGDQGFLAELYCEVRRFNLVGDITYCRGQVTEKERGEGARGRVRLDVQAYDQRGEVTLKGWAVVELPLR